MRQSLERLELASTPKLIIPKELKKKIDWLHNKVGAFEWSGELITREEGTINDLEDWKIICEDIFLADIGTSGYTEYEAGKGGFKQSDIVELYDVYPGVLEGRQKLQHVHTHHNMASFFSSTDWENLEDRAAASNYFLMLIVNFSGNYCAKVAFKAQVKGKKGEILNFANNFDNYKPIQMMDGGDKEMLVVMDCKIEVEEDMLVISKEFETRYEKVKEEKDKQKAIKTVYPHTKQTGLWEGFDDDWGQGSWKDSQDWMKEWEFTAGEWKKRDKKISELTDKEWEQREMMEEAHRVVGGKMELRHARAYLNSILNNTYLGDGYRDCISILRTKDKELFTKEKMEDYMVEFQQNLQDHFDVVFPHRSIEDYVSLMEEIKSYLNPFSYTRLIKEIVEAVEDEIEMTVDRDLKNQFNTQNYGRSNH